MTLGENEMTHLILTCVLWGVLGLGSLIVLFSAPKVMAALEPRLPRPTFADRVARELRAPDADLREALREVDHIGYNAPAVAVAEPVAPTLMLAGNSMWRLAAAAQKQATYDVASAQMAAMRNAGRDASPAANAQAANQGYDMSVEGLLLARNIFGMNMSNAAQQEVREFRAAPVVDSRPWFWPYVYADIGLDRYMLQERFGGGRVSREWLEAHRNDIVPALRRLNGKDGA